jgi:hypothetical protein
MTVPTSVEVLLAQQIFWLQRRVYEMREDPDALRVLAQLIHANIIYITGNNKQSQDLEPPLLADNLSKKEKANIMRGYVFELLKLTMALARMWIDEKRRAML